MIFVRNSFVSLLAFLVLSTAAQAHRLNESYLYFNVTDTSLSGRIEATTKDLGQLFHLDNDGDGTVSDEEVAAQGPQIFDFFAKSLKVADGSRIYDLDYSGVDFLGTPQGTFAQFFYIIPEVTTTPESVEVTYDSPFEKVLPRHLGYAVIESNTRTGLVDNEAYISVVFAPGQSTQTLSLTGEPKMKIFVDFVKRGMAHVWEGFDHMVFLVGLLLSAVLVLHGTVWKPAPNIGAALIYGVKVATVFTLAHSFTVALSALGILSISSTPIEIVIALSIAAVALMNMFPSLLKYSLWVVLVFGLFHGLGLGNILAPLGQVPSARIVGLAGFNVGVEFGQLAVLLVVLPVLFMLRTWRAYPFLALKLGSVVLPLLAGVWILERSTGIVYQFQQTYFG